MKLGALFSVLPIAPIGTSGIPVRGLLNALSL